MTSSFSPLLQEAQGVKATLLDLGTLTQSLSKATKDTFSSIKREGKSVSDYLRSFALSFSRRALTQAVSPLENLLSSSLTALFQPLLGSLGRITPFAQGGVLSSPFLFPIKGGTGLAGEAGAEAILPLSRNSDGTLGVKSTGAQGRPISVHVTIQTADFSGFQKSQTQVSALMAQAVRRGLRAL